MELDWFYRPFLATSDQWSVTRPHGLPPSRLKQALSEAEDIME